MKNIASFGFRLLGIYHKLESISLFCLRVAYIKSATWCKRGVSSVSLCEWSPQTPINIHGEIGTRKQEAKERKEESLWKLLWAPGPMSPSGEQKTCRIHPADNMRTPRSHMWPLAACIEVGWVTRSAPGQWMLEVNRTARSHDSWWGTELIEGLSQNQFRVWGERCRVKAICSQWQHLSSCNGSMMTKRDTKKHGLQSTSPHYINRKGANNVFILFKCKILKIFYC